MLFMASGPSARRARASVEPRRRPVSRPLVARPRPLPAPAPVVASPVVKWVGGKTKLLSELIERLPPRMGRYYEPFAGGAALFFRVAPARAVINDGNADLIRTYRALAIDSDAV